MGSDSETVNCQRQTIDRETGEVQTWEHVSGPDGGTWRPAYDQDAADLERWMLQGYARRALFHVEERDKRARVPWSEFAYCSEVTTRRVRSVKVADRYFVEGEPIPAFSRLDRTVVTMRQKKAARFRVINCCRDKLAADVAPEIWYSDKSQRASYHKVGVCGSVWTCPICSRRINLARQAHIRAAYDLFVTGKAELSPGVRDGDAVMVTFTVKHGVGDDLAVLFDRLKEADRGRLQKSYTYKRLTGYTKYKTVKGERFRVDVPSILGYVGRVTATEVTHGKNGWHPHMHQLWFFDRRLTEQELRDLRRDLFREWREACRAVGLPLPVEFVKGKAIGVDVRRALSAEEYLTKFGHDREWGPEREIASQHVKRSNGGRTAFQLLYDFAQGDKTAGGLFRVFAEGTLGRHQLQWSQGLRERLEALGLADLLAADEDLAAARDDGARLLGELDEDDWDALCGADQHGIEAHGTVLAICKRSGLDAARDWLRSLPSYVGHRSRRVVVEDREAYAGDALRSRSRFFHIAEQLGGIWGVKTADDVDVSGLEPVERARLWRRLERDALAVFRQSPEFEP